MRAKYLRARPHRLCMLSLALALALSSVACRAPRPEPEPATATRAEVTDALRLQLGLVQERHRILSLRDSEDAQNEQEILAELATEIALRIILFDPDARLDFSMSDRSGG